MCVLDMCIELFSFLFNNFSISFLDVLGLICLEFGDIQDAVVNQINDGVSTTVYISCNQGFDLVGKSKIKCINGAWEYISKPKCVKRMNINILLIFN